MPTLRRAHASMTVQQAEELDWDLRIGGHPWPGMSDEQAVEVLKQAWEVRRDVLLAQRDCPGRRPACWWMFDQDRGAPQTAVGEAVALAELGELDEVELGALFARADRAVAGTAADKLAEAVAAAVADALSLDRHDKNQTDKGVK